MLDRLVQHDLLGCYCEWSTVPVSVARVGTRFSRGNPFIDIDDDLHRMRPSMEAAFLAFYPQLQDFVQQQRGALD
jgi:acyl carrier protein phosphodiesterase